MVQKNDSEDGLFFFYFSGEAQLRRSKLSDFRAELAVAGKTLHATVSPALGYEGLKPFSGDWPDKFEMKVTGYTHATSFLAKQKIVQQRSVAGITVNNSGFLFGLNFELKTPIGVESL